jgi:hypothetical protein
VPHGSGASLVAPGQEPIQRRRVEAQEEAWHAPGLDTGRQATTVTPVSESYGGARSQLALDALLQYAGDVSCPVHAELRAHFDAVFPHAHQAHGA